MPNLRLFKDVGALAPRRSMFDLSYRKIFTCDMGQLIPIMCDEVVPGDMMEIGNEVVVRYQPLVAPILHEVNVYTHYYFVPYRILWSDWEKFITGDVDGAFAGVLPRWSPTPTTGNAEGTLWDYFGLPTGIVPADALPVDFIRRAYNRVYNEFYRDENLQNAVAETNELILNRAWEKDYFSSALPWQQRGQAPALPISGTTSAVFNAANFVGSNAGPTSSWLSFTQTAGDKRLGNSAGLQVAADNARATLNDNTVNLSAATTFNVSDLRLAFQIQKWMERNARAGVRYTEFLKAHYGVSPRDDRLQRPEYIGGSKAPVIVSEVLQTSQTGTTPQGNMAGHGLTAQKSYVAKYHAVEFGVIIGLMSVMPRTGYQQGIDRQWLRRSRFDFYSPEFANLSEQAIERAEIYATGTASENRTVFGFQGRYDELRTKRNMTCGKMRTTYAYWHLNRQFASAPLLNNTFVECVLASVFLRCSPSPV